MVFWIGILLSVVFAYAVVKFGFYETWIILFNSVIAIYLAITLRSAIINTIPAAAGDMPYGNALTILATAVVLFLIMQSIAYILFTSQFTILFPKILEILGSAFLGFLIGFLIWSFATLLVRTTPISQNTFVKEIGFIKNFEETNLPYINWWCNLVNMIVARKNNEYSAKLEIDNLVKITEARARKIKRIREAEPNEPTEPNDVKERLVTPPPKIEFDTQ